MELFEQKFQRDIKKSGPLANRIRPNSFEEFVGQEEILGEGKPLRQAIEQDKISSFILWGPPGSGKTTIANIIANLTKAHFERFNATTSGVPELRKVIQDAEERRKLYNRKTILFLDEIHRFNKLQQDALLASVENGVITLIGATTENPSFELNSPLLSRLQVYQLKPLDDESIKTIINRALFDKERGLGEYRVRLSKEAMEQLIFIADGDVRLALNALELAVQTCKPDENNIRFITAEKIQAAAQKKILKYDKTGEEHYNLISAYIKSIRGSNPHASIYWLARMLEAGEDPRFIARRLVILASEDIGNADPQALVVATAAAQAVEFVGMPEAQINLAQATTYLSCAPKSNASYMALLTALEDVRRLSAYPVPLHLRNAPTQLMKELGYGEGYKYVHDYEGNVVEAIHEVIAERGEQEYLPKELKDKIYYRPR